MCVVVKVERARAAREKSLTFFCGLKATKKSIKLTILSLAEQIVVLADEFVIVEDIQLFAGAELLSTNAAREAI